MIVSMYAPFYILYITICDTFIQTYGHKKSVYAKLHRPYGMVIYGFLKATVDYT